MADALADLRAGFGDAAMAEIARRFETTRPHLATALRLAEDRPDIAADILEGGRRLKQALADGKADTLRPTAAQLQAASTRVYGSETAHQARGPEVEAAAALYALRVADTTKPGFQPAVFEQAMRDVVPAGTLIDDFGTLGVPTVEAGISEPGADVTPAFPQTNSKAAPAADDGLTDSQGQPLPTLPPEMPGGVNRPRPLPRNQANLRRGSIYRTARGLAVWDGALFVSQQKIPGGVSSRAQPTKQQLAGILHGQGFKDREIRAMLDDPEVVANLSRSLGPVGPGPLPGSTNIMDRADKVGRAVFGSKLDDPSAPILRRGGAQGVAAMAAFAASLDLDPDKSAEVVARMQAAVLANPQSDAVRAFFEADGSAETAKAFVDAPLEITATVVGESIAQFGAVLVGAGAATAAGGPVAGAATLFGGSFSIEAGAKILETLVKAGVDLTDETQLAAAFRDRELMDRARNLAGKKAIPIALFDATLFGIAGRIFSPVSKAVPKPLSGVPGKEIAGRVAGGTAEVGAQIAGGAAGELAGQFAAGEDLNVPQIAAEAIGELGSGSVEIGIAAANRRPASFTFEEAAGAPSVEDDRSSLGRMEPDLSAREPLGEPQGEPLPDTRPAPRPPKARQPTKRMKVDLRALGYTEEEIADLSREEARSAIMGSPGERVSSGPPAPIVELRGDEFGPETDLIKLRKLATEFGEKNLAGNTVVNEETGIVVGIPRQSIRKTLSFTPTRDTVVSIVALPEMIRTGRYLGAELDRRSRGQFKAIHIFRSRLKVGDNLHRVEIIARERNDGTFFYNHSLFDDE